MHLSPPARLFVVSALAVSQFALPLAAGAAPTPGQAQPGPTAGLGLNPGSRVSDAVPDDSGAADGRYLIEFTQFGPPGLQAVRAAGGQVVHELPSVSAVAARLPQQAIAALQRNPHVRTVEPDPRRYMQALTDVPMSSGETKPYGIQMVQADQVSDLSTAGTRKVCIIDSGYSMAHEDLPKGQTTYVAGIPDTPVYGSWDANTGDWFVDKHGHGTHVVGTIAAIGGNDLGVVGTLPASVSQNKLKLHIVKVFGDDGTWTYSSDLIAALDRCREYQSNIVSMSLGGSWKSRLEERAFNNAYNAGVLPIAAAGNAGNTSVSYPAGYGSVVSVAAVDASENVASFSQRNSDVELAAPGVSVLSTVPFKETNTVTVGATTYSGTYVEGALRTDPSVSGAVVDGGDCNTTQAHPGPWSGRVVLCARDGVTSFATKVGNVQNGGGVAAVLYNHEDGTLYGTLNGTSTIPAVGLTKTDGAALKAQVGASSTVVSRRDSTGDYAAWNGTSMATPHVSGVAALIWSYNTAWTNAQMREALQRTAKERGPTGKDSAYGHGIVQAKAALDYLRATYGGGTVDTTSPQVLSIRRAEADPSNATSVTFTVTFSESVKGVDATDFALTGTGATGASLAAVSGEGSSYTVAVNTGSDGTLGLHLVDNDSITDAAGNKLGGEGAGNGTFTGGEVYTVDKSAPTVSITAPTNGATLSGSATLAATADGTGSGIAGVQFMVGSTSLGAEDTAAPYEAQWDTRTFPNGTYSLTAVARDGAGNTATSAAVTVTVSNATLSNTMYVGSLDGSASTHGKNAWKATVRVTVVDANSQPVSGAVVAGTWSKGGSGSVSCTTATDGTCSVTSGRLDKAVSSVTFTVDNVSGTLTYDPSKNVDADATTAGTNITVTRPTSTSNSKP